MRESLNKTTVEVCKTQEGLYFLLAIRCWPFHNPCNLYWVHLRLSMQDDEAQIFDLGPCKLALVMSEIEFVLSESFQYQMCDSVMLFHRLCKDEDVIQVDTDHTSVMRSWKMSFIMVWKVAGLLVRPKNITRGLKSPRLVRNATFHSSPSLTRTLLYPHRTSSLVKYCVPRRQLIRSEMSRSG